MGDFNTPAIHWSYSSDEPGTLTCSNSNVSTAEAKLTALAAHHRLAQINFNPNQRNVFLDLCFTTNHENCVISRPSSDELIERESVLHNAIELSMSFNNNDARKTERNLFNFSEKGRLIKQELNNYEFKWFSEEEFGQTGVMEIHCKIDIVISDWQDILRRNTVSRVRNLPIDLSTHRWSRDATYHLLFKIKQTAKATYIKHRTVQNKEQLKTANQKLSTHYTYLTR